MKIRNISWKLTACLSLMVLVLFSALRSERVRAIEDPSIRTGLVGFTFGQTIRLNLVSVEDPNLRHGPRQVDLKLYDGDGVMLAHSRVWVYPGRSAALELNRDVLDREGNRIEVRAVVRGIDDPNLRNIKPTLEVFDNSSARTSLFVGTPDFYEDPNQ